MRAGSRASRCAPLRASRVVATTIRVVAGCSACAACAAPSHQVESIQNEVSRALGPSPPPARCKPAESYRAEAWPEADTLFHRDPRWLGGDAAYSVPLGLDRVLWLFGDSFIATSDEHVRAESKMVRNSVAIQSGTDPTTSTIDFSWREDAAPSSFFPEDGDRWFWPLHGARVGGELVLFLNELVESDEGLGFESVGTRELRISNPDAPPADWRWTGRDLPRDGRSHGVSVVAAGTFLYSLTTRSSSLFFDVELERWSIDDLSGDAAPWNGERFARNKRGKPVWTGGAPEFVTAAHCGEWLTVESPGFGATDLAIRRAPGLAGPWSDPVSVFRPEESNRENPLVYAGKLHPELTGADLVVTYATNGFEFAELLRDESLYFPRLVRIEERR